MKNTDYQCPQCAKVCSTPTHLGQHMVKHSKQGKSAAAVYTCLTIAISVILLPVLYVYAFLPWWALVWEGAQNFFCPESFHVPSFVSASISQLSSKECGAKMEAEVCKLALQNLRDWISSEEWLWTILKWMNTLSMLTIWALQRQFKFWDPTVMRFVELELLLPTIWSGAIETIDLKFWWRQWGLSTMATNLRLSRNGWE